MLCSITILLHRDPGKLALWLHTIYTYILNFFVLALMPARKQLVFLLCVGLCATNCTAQCVRDIVLSRLVILFLWATVRFLYFVSHLRAAEGSFSFRTCSPFSLNLALTGQTLLFSFYRPLFAYLFLKIPRFLSSSLIFSYYSWFADVHQNINSKLYSMLSTALPFPPHINPSSYLHLFHPRSFTPGRITVRLRGGGGTRWLPT